MIKTHFFDEKQQQNVKGVYLMINCNNILYCELVLLTRDVTCPKLCRDTAKAWVIRNCQWDTLYVTIFN